MAATCSHISTNASAPSESLVPSHSRKVSTISSTLHTNTTVHSQPTEPLLRPTTPEAEKYRDGTSHRLRNSEISLGLPQWSQSHVMRSHAAPIVSDKEKGLKNPLKRVKLLRSIKNGLVIVMGKLILCLPLEITKHFTSQYHPFSTLCFYLHLSNFSNDYHN